MSRARRYLSSLSVTPIGVLVLVVLVIAIGLFLLGPHSLQTPALVTGVIVLIGVVGGVPLGRNADFGWRGGNLAERREAFHPRAQRACDEPLSAEEEAELWRKEREHYQQDEPAG